MQELNHRSAKVTTLSETHTVSVRAVLPEDMEKLRGMFSRLSPKTIYQRFHTPFPAVPDWMITHIAGLGHHDGDSLVTVVWGEIVGHAMYVRTGDKGKAEVALVIEDGWQSGGVGKVLLRKLAREAKRRDAEIFTGTALGENRRVLGLLRSVFVEVESVIEDGSYQLRMPLRTLKPVAEHDGRARFLWHAVEEKLAS